MSCSYASSIAEWVVRHKESCCSSNPEKHKKFRIEVDRPSGLAAVKRLLSVPLWDLHDGAVVGAVHIINKVAAHERFSMADERFAASYGELAGALVASSAKYNRLENQSQSMCSLAQAPLQLIDSFHDVEVMTLAGALCALEETLRETLHCANAKAYLFSPDRDESEQKGGDVGDHLSLFTLDLPPLSLKGAPRDGSSVQIKRCPLSAKDDPDFKPSIVAYTVNTQRTYLAGTIVPPDHHDYAALRPEGAEYNSAVDMAPSSSQVKMSKSFGSLEGSGKDKAVPVFYCVPIINLKQEVIGCLQASPSSKSPPLKSTLDIGTSEQIHSITFQDAMGWAGYLLSYSKINQPIDRHGFFLEPLSITKDMFAMEISLAPSEPEKVMPSVSPPLGLYLCSSFDILEWNRSYDSLKKPTSSGGGGGGGSNQGSNNNTGRTTPEKDAMSRSVMVDSSDSPGADLASARLSEEATGTPVKKRKDLKEYVTKMRDMHRVIEKLRLEDEAIRTQQVQKELESGSAGARKEAADKRAEVDKLKSQMEEFKAAAKRRDEARATGEERRKREQQQAEKERQQRQEGAEEFARLRAEEAQKHADEEAAAKKKAEEEEQLALEKKKAEEDTAALVKDQAEEDARLEKIRLEEVEAERQRAEDAAIIREAEEEAAKKLREEEERERLVVSEDKVGEEHVDDVQDEDKAKDEDDVLKEGTIVEGETTVEDDKADIDIMQQAFGEVNGVDQNEVQHDENDDVALCWEECLDDNGEIFYFNTQTEESVWDAPEKYKPLPSNEVEEAGAGAGAGAGGDEINGWVRMEDNSGEVYWVNEDTGETEWGATPPV
eukprot:CAMPEP_0114427716 /NCGR_PEP_ID=MMETSP0103-20121206/8514_1 /TAXON_ID=37642 ORGANISM="Paraphysomonas imperforata, Strain PA2" /NCGR_SAMPLE_ID=MMETSP0103 /ASSEMBLY_ACC=CAM_ASM_000201 /LENGTH=830 /DNA_ID=CAMNT_0001596831 /DNA_START=220 /DNA_END=2716 /DNA_ORIENTATION=-